MIVKKTFTRIFLFSNFLLFRFRALFIIFSIWYYRVKVKRDRGYTPKIPTVYKTFSKNQLPLNLYHRILVKNDNNNRKNEKEKPRSSTRVFFLLYTHTHPQNQTSRFVCFANKAAGFTYFHTFKQHHKYLIL